MCVYSSVGGYGGIHPGSLVSAPQTLVRRLCWFAGPHTLNSPQERTRAVISPVMYTVHFVLCVPLLLVHKLFLSLHLEICNRVLFLLFSV
jgi:hypothetical protein